MSLKNKTIITLQEIEALLAPQGPKAAPVDWFFPYRSLFIAILGFASGLSLIIAPETLALEFFTDPATVNRYTGVFYVRGWWTLGLGLFALYAYTRGKGDVLALVMIGAIVVNNFLLDFFSFYLLRFQSPTPEFSLVFACRALGLACVVINLMRCNRLPPVGERWNFRAAIERESAPPRI
ncbi:MAG: hypothetical protein RL412_489 [Pseudomonadota bacterium]|jgi:hypothetical protein